MQHYGKKITHLIFIQELGQSPLKCGCVLTGAVEFASEPDACAGGGSTFYAVSAKIFIDYNDRIGGS